ncbi:DUF4292 domain-containing protein [Flagellimonas zhangzhouensis]|uniref:Outer membrane lipoprotein-sorting protein n=1 Tax=Flagellimonas zhangzhouensis TaxID=1073328 RepID=A0A1H2UNG6_9FLAO|nr:DUF4292 domain-containing protein [Allomuricauda zhangzhouensis]SDQ15354.1 protein of unknown function [Allomuricauda zhangzhouensis]SDW57676.1 protein of unknown function [Allomuricauda zhangzhouensis]
MQRYRSIVTKISFVLIAVLTLGACKGTKAITGGEVDARMSTNSIIKNHYSNQSEFKTLSGKVKIDYTDGEDSQGVNVSLRMEKDKVIWMSAPLGVVKAHITPEKVSFYNKLNNEYFDGDFSYLSNLLGTELDFEKVQNLLLGNAVLDLRREKFNSGVYEGNYQLTPKKARELFKIIFQVEPKNFKIASQEISQPEQARQLKANYTYQDISGKVLPDQINIVAEEEGDFTTIELSFRNLELDKPMNFPYKVPKGYDKITLK